MLTATVVGESLCAVFVSHKIQGQATAAVFFFCAFFTSLFNCRPQANYTTLIRPWSMLRSYFMIPVGCILVIITHHRITLAFTKQTSIDLLTHSMVSNDAQSFHYVCFSRNEKNWFPLRPTIRGSCSLAAPNLPTSTLNTKIGEVWKATKPWGLFAKPLNNNKTKASQEVS